MYVGGKLGLASCVNAKQWLQEIKLLSAYIKYLQNNML